MSRRKTTPKKIVTRSGPGIGWGIGFFMAKKAAEERKKQEEMKVRKEQKRHRRHG